MVKGRLKNILWFKYNYFTFEFKFTFPIVGTIKMLSISTRLPPKIKLQI